MKKKDTPATPPEEKAAIAPDATQAETAPEASQDDAPPPVTAPDAPASDALPEAALPVPSEGGCYIRLPDGTLVREEDA